MNISVRELLLSVLSIFQSLGCKIAMLYFMFSIWNKLIFEKLVWRTPKTIPYVLNILFVYLFIFPQKSIWCDDELPLLQ